MKVLKFGGTSVANAYRIKQLAKIVDGYGKTDRLIVVVSALSGVTNLLEESGELAQKGNKKFSEKIAEIEYRHMEVINQLIKPEFRSEIAAHVKMQCNDAEEICQGIYMLREYSDRSKARIQSLGEKMSSKVISVALNNLGLKNSVLDLSKIITTNSSYLAGRVDHVISKQKLVDAYTAPDNLLIAPGFVSTTINGETSVLGRGGSDLTAALVGKYLEANRIDIWTDVSGVLTASPKMVSSAYTIPELSYEEAMELSHFGAKVLYAPTIQPALEKKIPIMVKNTFSPEDKGTLITFKSKGNGHIVKGFSSIDEISLITITGTGLVGVHGMAARMFKALSDAEVNTFFVTHSSSEHTMSIGVSSSLVEEACDSLDAEFEQEIERKKVNAAFYESSLSILAMVGEHMKQSIGTAGRAFKLLGDNGINIRAISQGSTERNISIVISEKDTKKALNVLHDGFFLSKYRKIHIFNVGVGTVGGTMLNQLTQQAQYLRDEYAIEVKLVGVANSRKMMFNDQGIPLENWEETLDKTSSTMQIGEFISKMKSYNLRNSVFIDNTASKDVVKLYSEIADGNISIVASNKIMASSPLLEYEGFKRKMKSSGLKFLNETNVAAGLPVLNTIDDLIASGDKVLKIEAVLSGSLNYIFNTLSDKVSFTEAITQARDMGLTEPDPAIDISGLDVRRKILILARTAGYKIELDSVEKNEIVPEADLIAADFDALMKQLATNNQRLEALWRKAEAKGAKLRYIAEFNNGKASAGLQMVTADHPAYQLDGMDNIILLYTRRYVAQPLVIKGAGAGPDVTASGVFADVMRLANR